LENLHILRRNWMIFKENLKLHDPETAIDELMMFKRAGGNSLVDLTLPGIGRDPLALKEISIATGVNIITGTGWYLKETHPPFVKDKNIEELTEIMVGELREGIANTGIKAGLIGECALGYPIHENEEKVIRAASRAQVEVGCGYNIHPSLIDFENKTGPMNAPEILDTIQKEDANLDKFYFSHMDGRQQDLDYQRNLMDNYGVVLSFDQFGFHVYSDVIFPGCGGMSDKMRIDSLIELVESGYEKQLVLSHDVCSKGQTTKYGGFGYAHILKNIVPELRFRGLKESKIRTMIVDNPRRLLAY
jgi:phosphotriesterase-related protein